MKNLLIFIFSVITIQNYSQNLTQDVPAEIVILTDSISHLNQINCPELEISFFNNFFSYPEGMSLFLVIDSISENSDSILINQGTTIIDLNITPPYTIPIEESSDNILIDFYGTDIYPKLYLRIIAIGIPENGGEEYHCSYNRSYSTVPDDCGSGHFFYYAGNGPLDNTFDCSVDFLNNIERIQNKHTKIYPNPFQSFLYIELDINAYPVYFSISNIMGENILTGRITENKLLPIKTLLRGTYILRLQSPDGSTISKLIIKE